MGDAIKAITKPFASLGESGQSGSQQQSGSWESTQETTNQQNSSGTQERNPWEQQIPYLQDLWGQAQGSVGWRDGFDNSAQEQGWGQILDFAQNDMPGIFQNAQNSLNFLGSADQLDPASNPFLQANLDAMTGEIQRNLGEGLNQINQQSVGAGQFGGSRQGVAQGQAIGEANQIAADAASAMLMQNYQQGQQNMANAVQMAPVLTELGLMPGMLGSQVGQEQQQWANPWQDLLQYGNLVQAGNWGGTTTQEQNQTGTSTTTGSGSQQGTTTSQQTNQASPLDMFSTFMGAF